MRKTSWFFTILCGVVFAILIPNFALRGSQNDFIGYWSASRLLITGGNPYDENSLRNLEQTIRPDLKVVEVWNPPWLLLIFAPFGILPFDLALRFWTFCNVFLLVMALFLTWKMAVGSDYQSYFLLILAAGFLFGDTIFLIRIGQISTLILISLVLGVYFIEKEKDWLAGAVLFFTTIKPHLIYLVLAVVFVWSIRKRRLKIWAGMAIAGFSSILVSCFLFPDWLTFYRNAIYRMPYSGLYSSTLGSFINVIWGTEVFRYIGILLLPLAFPFSKIIPRIGWLTTVNLSLTISIPLSPYGFSFDQVLLLPAVTQMLSWIIKKEVPLPSALGIGMGLSFIYGALFWMSRRDLPDYRYFCVAFCICILYLLAWRYQGEKSL